MPDSATVRKPHIGILLATVLLPLLTPTTDAATALTPTTLLLVPEHLVSEHLPPGSRLPYDLIDRPARLAIVIDDVGYNLDRAEEILKLPVEITLGVLPYAPYAREIAERAAASGREIILHQPMEPTEFRRREPGTLELRMTAETFDAELAASFDRLPAVSGVNNHTGSLLTAHRLPMERLMHGIAERGLYFLDSRTTPDSVAETTARAWRVPTLRRDVFLDHVLTESGLQRALDDSLTIARAQGHAVVIAHPHPLTLDFLAATLARLSTDITLTALGDLVSVTGMPRRVHTVRSGQTAAGP